MVCSASEAACKDHNEKYNCRNRLTNLCIKSNIFVGTVFAGILLISYIWLQNFARTLTLGHSMGKLRNNYFLPLAGRPHCPTTVAQN